MKTWDVIFTIFLLLLCLWRFCSEFLLLGHANCFQHGQPNLHGSHYMACVCVFITWHMCVHYMACVCSIHVMFWFQKIQIIFCQACGATIFLLPYNQSFAQSRCDVAMHKAHAHANILHGHISYMTFVECASPSVACVLAAWAH